MIRVECLGCGQKYQAPDAAAGHTLACKKCSTKIAVPKPEIDPADILLGLDEPSETPEAQAKPKTKREPVVVEDSYTFADPDAPPVPRKQVQVSYSAPQKKIDVSTLPPLSADEAPFWRRHLHWLLVLAMVPLCLSLIFDNHNSTLEDRLLETLKQLSPAEQAAFGAKLPSDPDLEDVIKALPEKKFKGAWLPYDTGLHWLLALGATVLYFVFFLFLASDGSAKFWHVLLSGIATGTIGVLLLLLLQAIATNFGGRFIIGRGIGAIISLILTFIAFSYNAAANTENGFLLSFFGYTFGVGLCEELVKLLPLLMFWKIADPDSDSKAWRGLLIWGLASGAGFGICEGIMYSHRYYNGMSSANIYFVRFLSCVALHAVWSGSVGLTMYLKQNKFFEIDHWIQWVGLALTVIAVPMILHGLYDTCLKKDYNIAAIAVAIASFGWLAFLSSRLYRTDDAEATKAMLKEYKRRRKAMKA